MPKQSVTHSEHAQAVGNSRSEKRPNRFENYGLVITLLTIVSLVVFLEVLSYLVILAHGHQGHRGVYRYNREVSGYTVYKNVPGYDMAHATIRDDPSDPDVVLDEFGFLSDTPVSRKKPPNTVRIFILGGSAAIGAGQNVQYHNIHFYPDGVHSYPQNIAGQLKAYLEKRNPEIRHEVINTAAFQRQFHQSTLLYLETVSTLSPDYVVNIDGYNDINSLLSGTPYEDAAQMLPGYLKLWEQSQSWLNQSNIFYALSIALEKYRGRSQATESARTAAETPTRLLTMEEYQRRKPTYLAATRRFEQTVKHHTAVLQADETRLIFMLQPILARLKNNKALSAIEQKLQAHNLALSDKDSAYITQYFLDDYVTHSLRKLITDAGGIFIDGNKAIASVDASVEFYTDYCHMTAAGNKIIAELIGQRILADQASLVALRSP